MTTTTAKELYRTPVLADKTSTGKGKYWQAVAYLEDGVAYTRTEYWQDGVQRQTSEPTRIEGKNLGRANETAPADQAVKEAKAAMELKIKKGYVPEGQARTRTLPLPMLAHQFEDREHDLRWPCYAQPKLDGTRALTDGERFWSRKGIEYPAECVAHLRHDTGGLIVDGELMLPKGELFEKTASAVKKYYPNLSPLLEFNVFDVCDPDAPFRERLHRVLGLFSAGVPDRWRPVPTKLVKDRAAAEALYDRFVDEGHEGIMFRNVEGLYKLKDRSKDLLKWKPMVDDEFVIVGWKEGTGKAAGTPIFKCLTADGKEFDCNPPGSYDSRGLLMAKLDELMGKRLTVEFQGYTAYGKPRFPRGKAIRDYEG
jgi:DNA ligase-1